MKCETNTIVHDLKAGVDLQWVPRDTSALATIRSILYCPDTLVKWVGQAVEFGIRAMATSLHSTSPQDRFPCDVVIEIVDSLRSRVRLGRPAKGNDQGHMIRHKEPRILACTKPCKENRAEASTDDACLIFTVIFTSKSWTYTTNDAYTRDIVTPPGHTSANVVRRFQQSASTSNGWIAKDKI
eukprot:scaffold146396_cov73-Cyclotella_meneghiniana.AAC.3